MQRKNNQKRRGAILVTSVVFVAIIAAIAASLLSMTNTQRRLNQRQVSIAKARSAAESAIEHGVAELASRYLRRSGIPANDLAAGNNPLSDPSVSSSFATNTDIIPGSMKVTGALAASPEWIFVNPNDPANEGDDMLGRRVFARKVSILGTAQVESTVGGPATAYAQEEFIIRDAPVFANAYFFNSDLDLNPAYEMFLSGNVHTNGNLNVYIQNGRAMTFDGLVTAVGGIFHSSFGAYGEEYRNAIQGADINFLASVEPKVFLSMDTGVVYPETNFTYLDSRISTWASDSNSRWNGFLRDSADAVAVQNVIAFDDYVPDDLTTPQIERNNGTYALIEPLLPAGHPDLKSIPVRRQKMAYRAGLTLKVSPTGAVEAFTPRRTNPNDAASDPVEGADGQIVFDPVTLPADVMGRPDNAHLEVVGPGFAPFVDSSTADIDNISSGLYDHRENRGVDTIALDVERLTDYIDNKDNSASGFQGTFDVDKQWNGVVYVEFPTSNNVDVSTGRAQFGDSAGKNNYNIVPAVPSELKFNNQPIERALMVIDAKNIPQPAGVEDQGLTISTNAPMYVVGSFNADGIPHANQETEPDNADEPPAALIADSITILSEYWGDHATPSEPATIGPDGQEVLPMNGNFRTSKVDGRQNIARDRVAAPFTEISAAILAGTPQFLGKERPAHTDRNIHRPLSMGGHNLGRFLEHHGSQATVAIRGSFVSLFESEVRPEGSVRAWYNHYNPPKRAYGFSSIFNNGVFPPGTPMIRQFRRTDYRELSETEYTNELASFNAP